MDFIYTHLILYIYNLHFKIITIVKVYMYL